MVGIMPKTARNYLASFPHVGSTAEPHRPFSRAIHFPSIRIGSVKRSFEVNAALSNPSSKPSSDESAQGHWTRVHTLPFSGFICQVVSTRNG